MRGELFPSSLCIKHIHRPFGLKTRKVCDLGSRLLSVSRSSLRAGRRGPSVARRAVKYPAVTVDSFIAFIFEKFRPIGLGTVPVKD